MNQCSGAYIVSDDGPDCGVTPGGTAVRTSPQLLPTYQSTRGTVSKVTAVGNLTRVVANRGFPANTTTQS